MRLLTIGFTKRRAEDFFEALRSAGVQRIVDVRLNNVSQLAGFAKRDDLRYFARVVCNADYVHLTSLAPTAEMLDDYRKGRISWDSYSEAFTRLMAERRLEVLAGQLLREGDCLLCSEPTPHQCHRRLVVEYLTAHGTGLEVQHL